MEAPLDPRRRPLGGQRIGIVDVEVRRARGARRVEFVERGQVDMDAVAFEEPVDRGAVDVERAGREPETGVPFDRRGEVPRREDRHDLAGLARGRTRTGSATARSRPGRSAMRCGRRPVRSRCRRLPSSPDTSWARDRSHRAAAAPRRCRERPSRPPSTRRPRDPRPRSPAARCHRRRTRRPPRERSTPARGRAPTRRTSRRVRGRSTGTNAIALILPSMCFSLLRSGAPVHPGATA